jgi:hypothetical protein
VAGQPLLIVERPAAAVGNTIKSHQSKAHNQRKGDSVDPPRPPRNQIQTSVAPPSIGMKSQVTANPFWSDPFESSAQSRQQPVAGPSKRPSSSITDPQEVVKKKARVCELGCGQPSHRVKDCPVVKAGTASYVLCCIDHLCHPTHDWNARKESNKRSKGTIQILQWQISSGGFARSLTSRRGPSQRLRRPG